MSKIQWDKVGERKWENGVDHGVLYKPNNAGEYAGGVAWNGLTTITESPSGAESTKQYADNRVYADLRSAEEYASTIEAFTYPDEFEECNGVAVVNGVRVAQQNRKPFGLVYRTNIGNDLDADAGYKLHLVYGLTAAPSEQAHATVNDSPELAAFSWEVSSVPVDVPGKKPSATLTVSSLDVPEANMQDLEDILFGTDGSDPRLPLPVEVFSLFAGTNTEVETQAPTYNASTDIVTIPAVTGVVYEVNGEAVTGSYGPITEDVVVTAKPAEGYTFTNTSDSDWTINFS